MPGLQVQKYNFSSWHSSYLIIRARRTIGSRTSAAFICFLMSFSSKMQNTVTTPTNTMISQDTIVTIVTMTPPCGSQGRRDAIGLAKMINSRLQAMISSAEGRHFFRTPVYCSSPATLDAKMPARAVGGISSPTPVSYTHLDVYKRQGNQLSESKTVVII